MVSKLVVLLSCALAVMGQKPARIGPDGKPLLNRPILEECKKRISHLEWGGHHYFLSWREPWHKFEDWDWFNGRNFCRDRCMDLVSFNTPDEFRVFAAIMKQDNVSSVWTSGRKCNFKGKGCDAAHLQPINVNGWFWAGAGNDRIPSTNQPSDKTYWSFTGERGERQPDNHEGREAGPIDTEFDIGVTIEGLQEYHDEACLAAQNNKYNDGVAWHDVACHFRSVIVCEDSQQLMDLVKSKDGEDVTNEVKEAEQDRKVELESIMANEVAPPTPNVPTQPPPVVRRPPPPRGRPGRFRPNLFGSGGRPKPRPARRPSSFLGALGLTRKNFPFLF